MLAGVGRTLGRQGASRGAAAASRTGPIDLEGILAARRAGSVPVTMGPTRRKPRPMVGPHSRAAMNTRGRAATPVAMGPTVNRRGVATPLPRSTTPRGVAPSPAVRTTLGNRRRAVAPLPRAVAPLPRKGTPVEIKGRMYGPPAPMYGPPAPMYGPPAPKATPQAKAAASGGTSSASGTRGKARNAMKKVNSMFVDRQVMGMNVSARTQKGILLGGAVAGGVMNRRGQGTSSGSQSIYRY